MDKISEQIKETQKNLQAEKITNFIINRINYLDKLEITKQVKLYLLNQIEDETKKIKKILED